jgi:hypothetical protein
MKRKSDKQQGPEAGSGRGRLITSGFGPTTAAPAPGPRGPGCSKSSGKDQRRGEGTRGRGDEGTRHHSVAAATWNFIGAATRQTRAPPPPPQPRPQPQAQPQCHDVGVYFWLGKEKARRLCAARHRKKGVKIKVLKTRLPPMPPSTSHLHLRLYLRHTGLRGGSGARLSRGLIHAWPEYLRAPGFRGY